jgi:hypothetical protein
MVHLGCEARLSYYPMQQKCQKNCIEFYAGNNGRLSKRHIQGLSRYTEEEKWGLKSDKIIYNGAW